MEITTLYTWLNGYLFVLDLCAVLVLMRYVLPRVGKGSQVPDVQAATAMLVYVLGHTIIRGTAWSWWLTGKQEIRLVEPTIGVGLVVITIGLTCALRVFAGPTMWRYGWLAYVAFSAFIATVATLWSIP